MHEKRSIICQDRLGTNATKPLADRRRPSAGGWNGNRSDYTTAVVGNMSISWLKKVIPGAKAGGKPFMAYIAPKACHEPFTPATWYAEHWDPAWPAQVRGRSETLLLLPLLLLLLLLLPLLLLASQPAATPTVDSSILTQHGGAGASASLVELLG
jgi:hypothetical protein